MKYQIMITEKDAQGQPWHRAFEYDKRWQAHRCLMNNSGAFPQQASDLLDAAEKTREQFVGGMMTPAALLIRAKVTQR